jgi:subtilisin family serine protease
VRYWRSTFTVVVCFAGLLALFPAPPEAPAWTKRESSEARYVRELLVKYRQGKRNDPFPQKITSRVTEKYGLTSLEKFDAFGIERFKFGGNVSTLIKAMATDPEIQFVEPNYIIGAAAPNDFDRNRNWGLEMIGMSRAWQSEDGQKKTPPVVVAVLDTGVDAAHQDLAGGIVLPGMAFCTDTTDGENPKVLKPVADVKDMVGHGTHVAGTIAARADNKFGIPGIAANARILPVKILCNQDTGTVADAVRGITWALDQKAEILNLSWTTETKSDALESILQGTAERKVLVVAAAGNNQRDIKARPVYPAGASLSEYLIVVGATDENDKLDSRSNWSSVLVQIAAPGANILSITPNDKTESFSGTSMSAAHVTGCAALVKRLYQSRYGKEIDIKDIKSRILDAAKSVLSKNHIEKGRRLDCGSAAEKG